MIDDDYIANLIDQGTKELEKATNYVASSALSFDKRAELHVDIANGYTSLARVAISVNVKN